MAIEFIHSFDNLATADLPGKLSGIVGATINGSGRSGSCLRLAAAADLGRVILTSVATRFSGNAMKISAYPAAATTILEIGDGATDVQVYCQLNTDGTLTVKRGGDNVALGSTSYVVPLAQWVYLEFKATIHDTTGAFTLRVNGTTRVSGSNIDTKNSANATCDRVVWKGCAAVNLDVDDLYIGNTTGSAPNNDFLGDVRVEGTLPTGAGNSAQWAPTGAASNRECVDDATPNGDTDYVASSTVNQKDTHAWADLTALTPTVYAVMVTAVARKDSPGTRAICPVIRRSGADYDGSNQNLSDSYAHLSQVYETDPSTGVAWTAAGVNAAEFGYKLTV